MRNMMIWAAFAVAIFSGPNALAQDTLIDNLVNACESDIQNYCSQVTPGNGRMLHCMAAHEDKISGQCQFAFYQAATVLEQIAVALSYLAQECITDIETHCNNVELGEGRILNCLAEHDAEIGEGCKKAVADTVAN